MRFSQRRHIGFTQPALVARQGQPFFAAVDSGFPPGPFEGEFAPRDYISFLLNVDAEIEHGLMVQYLYAAYSLGGPQVPEAHRAMVRGWQEVILGIAKEEMGHLITVQNVLRLIGAPLNFDRDDYPWTTPFYPFPFSLEPLTLDSLAKYVYAESPKDWSGPLADEIKARAEKGGPSLHRVGELFDLLLPLLKNPEYVPDSAFQPATYPFQASSAEWGRGYQGGNRGNSTGANPQTVPDVLVVPLWSRDEAVGALTQIAEQGEAPTSITAASHFTRFEQIYKEMKQHAMGWTPARTVATNPYVSAEASAIPGENENIPAQTSAITHPEARLWAQLHNVRYRMLLAYLSHSFTLSGGHPDVGARAPRGAIINATFGEMYSIRAISDILMQLPLKTKEDNNGLRAGPPFAMPYTLDIPASENDRWRGHLDLLDAANVLIELLLTKVPDTRKKYLLSVLDADQQMRGIAKSIIDAHVEPIFV